MSTNTSVDDTQVAEDLHSKAFANCLQVKECCETWLLIIGKNVT